MDLYYIGDRQHQNDSHYKLFLCRIDQAESESSFISSFTCGDQPNMHETQTELVDRKVSENIPYTPSLPYKMPMKLKKSIQDGTADLLVQYMVHKCIGVVIKNINGANDKCSICGTSTAFYCAGCKQWLCVSKNKNKVEYLYNHKVKGKKKHFAKVCWHEAHKNAWKHYFLQQHNYEDEQVVDVVPASLSESTTEEAVVP